MEQLNFHQLLHFHTVAREGSIQRASEVLHVTPANVSGQIKQLERSLKTQLLQKQGRGVVVTDAGQKVARYAEEIFSTGRELVQSLQGESRDPTLRLRVGVRDVMPKLVAFQLLQPAFKRDELITLDCHEGSLAELISALSIHKLDVVLSDRPLDPTYRIKAHSHRVGRSDVIIAGTSKLVQKYKPGFPKSLESAPFLLPTDDTVLRRELDRWFSENSIDVNVRGEFEDSAMIKVAAHHGMGLVAVPQIIEPQLRDFYKLSRVGVAAGLRESYYAIAVDRKIANPGVEAVIQADLDGCVK
ncbi:MAG: LysR family transcriptional regulator [Planctomycetota bacterium]